jgi:XRE family aerobic/anaerobic benzoate catabolism transcriptional regulator
MCFAVWVRATPEEHMRRVLAQGDMRPMEDNDEAMSDLRRILAVREPLYRMADLTLDTSRQTPAESLKALVKSLKTRQKLNSPGYAS